MITKKITLLEQSPKTIFIRIVSSCLELTILSSVPIFAIFSSGFPDHTDQTFLNIIAFTFYTGISLFFIVNLFTLIKYRLSFLQYSLNLKLRHPDGKAPSFAKGVLLRNFIPILSVFTLAYFFRMLGVVVFLLVNYAIPFLIKKQSLHDCLLNLTLTQNNPN